jgi:hypothetical protein
VFCLRLLVFGPLAVQLLTSLPELQSIAYGADPRPVRYDGDIRPLLSDRCFHCHGPDASDRHAGLRLDQVGGDEGAYRQAGDGIAIIKPGSAAESELWRRITSTDPDVMMPPPDSHKKPLTAQEQELFRRWIEEGAQYESFWAFIPPKPPLLPSAESISDSPIDQLARQRLHDEGLSPASPADRRTLIRRVTFDLTGLPPTRDEIQRFLNDDSPGAYEQLVIRLLDSPHYGEHMAKYWLDLVRFADTNGIHHDHLRDLSTYRDWVIRSFNANLTYDEFVRQQIAGDLYESPQPDHLIASGFHRLHLIIDRGTMLPEESFSRNVIDRVTSVGTAFLGLTLQCAVCHDHKYDPITMRDFYSLSGFFNNIDAEPETGPRSGTDFLRGLQEPYINLPSPQQAQQLEELKQALDMQATDADAWKQRVRNLEANVQAQTAERANEPVAKAPVDSDSRGTTSDGEDRAHQDSAAELADARHSLAAAEISRAAAQKAYDDLLLQIPAAMVMKERTEVRPTHILIRGAYDKPGEVIERGSPAFLPPMKSTSDVKSRMDLANWLVDPQNPLTARVAINRFWQQLFGVGLVRTSEDFGAQGEWPSHPELLDYLAVRFIELGWDVKAMMKEMVLSQTYQQSSLATPAAFRNDPQNRLLARGSRFRMDSEMIRDQILASSGKLNRQLFGKSVKPPQPAELWIAVSLPDTYPRIYTPDPGDQIYRRSLYTFWKRALPPPLMAIFNAPSREECIARRERTNTPLQALLLLNESEYLKASRHLASHTLSTTTDDSQRLRLIYETITSHLPDPQIEHAFLSLANDLKEMYIQAPELAAQMCADSSAGNATEASDSLSKAANSQAANSSVSDGSVADSSAQAELAAWTMVTSAIYNLDVTKTRQ